MEIMALDKNFVPTGMMRIPFFDLSWHRKYYETGEFQVQIRAPDYSPDMAYIYTKDRPELGMIQSVKFTGDDGMVLLSGYFYEKRLKDKIVWPVFNGYGTRAALAMQMITAYKADLPLAPGTVADGGEKIEKQETGGELEKVLQTMLMADEKAIRCRYDYAGNKMYVDVWQGRDRTQGQTENNFVTFSRGFRNIRKVAVKDDSSNYKNYAIVGGAGEGAGRIYVAVDLSGGQYRQQIFVDARSEQYDPEKQTLAEYKAALYQKGLEKLQSYVDIHNVEFEAVADSGARYLEDYDLGDKCDIIIEEIRRSWQARITEVCETWSKGIHTVTLTFGDKIPTLYERARVN